MSATVIYAANAPLDSEAAGSYAILVAVILIAVVVWLYLRKRGTR